MIRSTLRLKTPCRNIYKQRIAPWGLRRMFTTDIDTSSDTKDASDTNDMFWEIPEKKSDSEKAAHTSAGARDFRDLLDSLFERSTETSAVAAPQASTPPAPKPQKWSGSLIERRLLEMVARSSKTYQEKGPLPRGVSTPLYGKNRIQQARSEERSLGDRKKIIGDISLAARDNEIRVIDAILETKTGYDLLQLVLNEIYIPPDTAYPHHYARALTKSIQHASMAFHDPYLSMTIFEQAKTKSIESYVVGCTIDVYNAMLQVRWQSWRDVVGMMNLVDEMTVNGVEYDDNTRRIVRNIVRDVEGESEYDFSDEAHSEIAWSIDERRAVNTMKTLVGKWMVL